jgi:hypothetical protein
MQSLPAQPKPGEPPRTRQASDRLEWRAAIKAAKLPQVHRHVAAVFAAFATDPADVFAEVGVILEDTGLGRSTVYYALHGRPARPGTATRRPERRIVGLIEGGWLTRVRDRRQHYAPRYRLTIPEPQAAQETPAAPPAPEPLPVDVSGDSGAVRAGGPGPGAALLAEAIRQAVPETARPDHAPLAQAVRELPSRGWTPALVAQAAADRPGGWGGARPGLVMTWARGLTVPPAAPPPPPPHCGECDERSRMIDVAPSAKYPNGGTARCPRCHPLTAAAPLFSGG